MLDFVRVSTRATKRGVEVYPKFVVKKTKDLMIRGGSFYAIWDEGTGLWSTDPYRAIELIDEETRKAYENMHDPNVIPLYLWDASSKMIDDWNHYVTSQCTDNYVPLDESLTFSNQMVKREDHVSHRLTYPIGPGPMDSYDELMDVLYSPGERHKIEWIIGSVVTGDSKDLQKFLVLYGSAGTGKSTVLNIVQMLFDGYYCVFDAKALGSANNAFAMESFKSNPLVAIQHDGDLSRIEDNTRLNSLVSHELMTVNEKFKSTYSERFNTMLFMGTNRPVKITDAKSGIIRRLIDASPTGDKVSHQRYNILTSQIKFELGAIAYHCAEVFRDDPQFYDNYIPKTMIGASNTFYNFILDNFPIFADEDGITLKEAWKVYKVYCDDAQVPFKMSMMVFKEELKNYFDNFEERYRLEDGTQVWNYYRNFRKDKFATHTDGHEEKKPEKTWLSLDCVDSILDEELKDCPAQYANEEGTPCVAWINCLTKLQDIKSTELHYVKPPENHIVIDIDLKDAEGNKSVRRSIEAARKFPKTYAEFSKSGAGIHLHYIWDGDVTKLSTLYDIGIEIKTFLGGASLRRKLSRCNSEPIAHLNTGLPLKGEDKMVTFEGLKNEKALRTLIVKNLNKEIHPGTKPSIDFIYKILNDAYKSGMKYDVSDMRPAVDVFANGSTNHADYCLQMVDRMPFKSDEPSENLENYSKDSIVFFDVEVFPNLFILCWKFEGSDTVIKLINPKPVAIEQVLKMKLVGFNNRRYDNHIIYARAMGYTNEQLYTLSQRIINAKKNDGANCFFGEAYNLSYTDIYDFSSKKQSLKKFEIDLGIHHQECGLPWDQPVPEDRWEEVAEYCANDVVATEAVWKDRQADFTARCILADLADMTVNDTTNSLTARIIFGKERHPQGSFYYRNLGEPVKNLDKEMETFLKEKTTLDLTADPKSKLPYFEGYSYDKINKESTYAGEVVGEGGYVYSQPNMYGRCKVFDVASMHPHSITSEYMFGKYTERFNDLMEARVFIKHGQYDEAGKLFDGKLEKYLVDKNIAKSLAGALKIAINSVYGLTAAKFDNPFHDPRNVDNIVAKRGALFMITLKNECIKHGWTVVHCKTDSIKIYNPTEEAEKFIMNYGKKYGYTFEVENVFDRVCLVNDAVFVAKCDADDPESPGEWTATGAQFAVPFVFKTLFSKEPIIFEDLCETKAVSTAMYLDMNEDMPEGEHDYKFVGKVGLFCPMKPGSGGGLLVRENGSKYDSVVGTKGWRWMESEEVKKRGLENQVNLDYYRKLVDDAVETIGKFGNVDEFLDENGYFPNFLNYPNSEIEPGLPF